MLPEEQALWTRVGDEDVMAGQPIACSRDVTAPAHPGHHTRPRPTRLVMPSAGS